MKRFGWLIWILIGFGVTAGAQNTPEQHLVTGIIRDSVTNKPVAYATISLFDTLKNNVASAYSLENGLFKIIVHKPGRYRVETSVVGYQTTEFDIVLTVTRSPTKLNDVLLVPGHDLLEEVRITSRKRLVEQKPGMLVYNAENDVTNKGGTAADVLRKAPILNVDAQGNVSMRGGSNLKILINGKYSGQMARSAADALNMMPADMIKSVEVITTPSAKYDAEGAAGVINIITKKGKSEKSGTLEASISNLEQMLNPRFSFAKQKWNINIAGHLHRLRRKSAELVDRTSFSENTETNRLEQTIEKDNAAPHGSADLSVDYAIDEVSELSLGMNAWIGHWPDGSGTISTVRSPGGNITEQYLQNIRSSRSYLGVDMNLGYSRQLRKSGGKVTVLLQSSPSRDLAKYDASRTTTNKDLLYRELNDSKTRNREWTLQADYIYPLNAKGTLHLEAGAKLILRNVGNRYDVSASDTQQADKMILQPERSDDFRYSQDVMAGYSMLKMNLKNNWYVEAGARLEATFIEGSLIHKGTAFDNKFLNFVPTTTVSKKLDERSTLSLSYTKRLTRPYIWDINPNVNASDPKNIESGNPELQPEIAHQAELSYGLNTGESFFLNAAIFWKQTDNAIIEYMETNSEGISYTSKQNLAGNKQYGFNLSATSNFSPRWTLNGNANINYYDFDSKALDIFRSGWGSDININTTYRFPNGLSVQAFGEYDTRKVTLLGTLGRRYHYSFAAKKEIKKARITITLAAVNPFTKYISQPDIKERPAFISIVDNRYYNRALKLTVNWEFGGKLQQKDRKKVDNNDIKVEGRG